MSEGWVKLYRQLTEWEWYSDIPTKVVYIHLLLKANFTEGNFKGITIPRGSLVTGRRKLAEETGLTEDKVRTALKHLKDTHEITIKSYSKFSVVTLVNYDKFQDNPQQVPNKSPANPQQVPNKSPQYKKERMEERKNNISPAGQEKGSDYGYVPPDKKF